MALLQDKVAVITGASTGIGRACATLFARQGAKLVVSARRRAELDRLVDEITSAGGAAVACAGDVRDEALAQEVARLATSRFGGLDIALNNAGLVGDMAPTPDISLESWREIVDTNLTSAFLGAKHQVPAMLARGGGSLIFTASFVGVTLGMPGMAAYAAAKAGLTGLTRVLAAELGPQRIRVNALLPGGTETPAAQGHIGTPEGRTFVEGMHALKRIAQPEEIAHAALFLASDMASFVTGSALFADGGVSICKT